MTESIINWNEIQRVQRSLTDCLFHNSHLHSNGNTCISCENAKVYLSNLKKQREIIKQKQK